MPRTIWFRYRGSVLLLQSAFDEALDEYPDEYCVYKLPVEIAVDVDDVRWDLFEKTPITMLGTIPVREVLFDTTKRQSLEACVRRIL